jgi:hypothetical protein
LFFTVSFIINDNFPVVPASSMCKDRNGFFSFSPITVRAVPDELLNTTTGKYSMGFFLTHAGLVLEILSNVFPKSDFEAKFATTGMRFILTRFIMVRLSMDR